MPPKKPRHLAVYMPGDPKDLTDIANIDAECYGMMSKSRAWFSKQLLSDTKVFSCIGKTITTGKTVSYLLGVQNPDCIEILRIGVLPEYQRHGVAKNMVGQVVLERPVQVKKFLTLLPDSQLAGHLFFKAVGWTCVKVIKAPFEDNVDDGYLFELRVK